MKKIVIETYDQFGEFKEAYQKNKEIKGVMKLGHTVLNINEWYDTNPAKYEHVTGLDKKQLEEIVYMHDVVVEEPTEGFEKGQIISAEEYNTARKEGTKDLKVLWGAEAIRFILAQIDYPKLRNKTVDELTAAEERMENYEESYNKKIESGELKEIMSEEEHESLPEETKRLFDDMEQTRNEIDRLSCKIRAIEEIHCMDGMQRLFIDEITMFPLQLRTIVNDLPEPVMEDLWRLYSSVCFSSQEVGLLVKMDAPEVIIRLKRMELQTMVDHLIANGKRGKAKSWNPGKFTQGCGLTSLSDIVLMNTKLV